MAGSNQDICPVMALEQYIAVAKIDLGEDLPLFEALSSSKYTSKVRCQGLSYHRAREIVKDAFKDITEVSFASLQSLRGGEEPTLPPSNAGINHNVILFLKSWLSENAKDCVMFETIFNPYCLSRNH